MSNAAEAVLPRARGSRRPKLHIAPHAPQAPAPGPAPARINWSAAGVILALAGQAVALVVFFASLDQRLVTVEDAVAPLQDGQLARIDERTQLILDRMTELGRRVEGGGR